MPISLRNKLKKSVKVSNNSENKAVDIVSNVRDNSFEKE